VTPTTPSLVFSHLEPSSTRPASKTSVNQNATGRELAYLLLRLTLGVNILMHGLARILSGLSPFAVEVMKQFASTPMPPPLVHAFAIALPWSELFLGIAILFGLWTIPALALGALEIILLTFGIALTQNWSVAAIQMIYAIVYAILLAFTEYNRWSIDGWRDTAHRPRPSP
jgi:thiosulfate dehydrogenase (quinone) large subunit